MRSTRSRRTTCGSGCTWRICAIATRCCSTGCCPSTSRRCCRSSTPRRWAWRSSGSATSSAAPAGSTCRWTTRRRSRPRCATPAWARTTSTCWSPPTPRASSASATRASAASRSRSASSPVYTAAAGIHPRRVLPVVLDMGTDNLKLLNDEMYLGERHARVRDQRYDDLIDAYVTACEQAVPERDAALGGLRRDQRPTDPGQVRRAGAAPSTTTCRALPPWCWPRRSPRCGRPGRGMRDQRVVIYGAGTAGLGIADMMRDQMVREGLSPEEATRRFYPLGRRGMHRRRPDRPTCWTSSSPVRADPGTRSPAGRRPGRRIGLAEVVAQRASDDADRHLDPGRRVHRGDRAGHGRAHRSGRSSCRCRTRRRSARRCPPDLLAWTDGRALVATGSPFDPVEHDGLTYQIAQANNALVFPGLGLGVTVVPGDRGSATGMIAAAADAVAKLSDATSPARRCCRRWATCARSPRRWPSRWRGPRPPRAWPGRALHDPIQQVHQAMWRPEYPRVEVKPL